MLVWIHVAAAQPVVDVSTFQALVGKQDNAQVYHVVSAQVDQLEALWTLTGEQKTWDFTPFDYEEPQQEVVRYLPYTSDLPAADRFPEATMVLEEDTTYTYLRLSEDGLYWLGTVVDTLVLRPNRSYLLYKLPLAYGETWELTIPVDSLVYYGFGAYQDTTGLLGGQEVRIRLTVDGYGTLQTPAGTEPVLRITQEITYTGLTPPLPSELTLARNVSFVTPDLRLSAWVNSILSIVPGVPPTYTLKPGSGGYAVHEYTEATAAESPELPELFRMEVFPVPAHERVWIRVQGEETVPLEVTLYNLLGQAVYREERLRTTGPLTLDLQGLPAGVYMLKLQQGATVRYLRLPVVH